MLPILPTLVDIYLERKEENNLFVISVHLFSSSSTHVFSSSILHEQPTGDRDPQKRRLILMSEPEKLAMFLKKEQKEVQQCSNNLIFL